MRLSILAAAVAIVAIAIPAQADAARLAGRRCFVMRRLPGRPLMGGIRTHELLKSLPKLFRLVVDTTVEAQVSLHRLDAAPLVDALPDVPLGVDRWFERLAAFDGLAGGLDWLVKNRPADGERVGNYEPPKPPPPTPLWESKPWASHAPLPDILKPARPRGLRPWKERL